MSIHPFLWFDDQAEEAATFYCGVFPESRIDEILRQPTDSHTPEGSVMTVRFTINGTQFTALNGGAQGFSFNEAVSFWVPCVDQDEVDRYWDALLAGGGEEIACGWLKDRYGVRWQIVPDGLLELFADPDRDRAARAFATMQTQTKLDLPAIRAAADGA